MVIHRCDDDGLDDDAMYRPDPKASPKQTAAPSPARIKAARLGAGLTQVEAAALVHRTGPKSRNRWSEWENGHVTMPLAEWELFTLKTQK